MPAGHLILSDSGALRAGAGLRGTVRFRVLDLAALPRPEERTEVLPPKGSWRLDPPLPPGAYTLELWGSRTPERRRVPFVIRAGKPTRMRVPK